MKILLLTNFFPPTHTGGTEIFTYGIASSMVKSGHQVYVGCAGTWNSGPDWLNGYTDEIFDDIHVRRFKLNWTKAPDPNTGLYKNEIISDQIQNYAVETGVEVVHITSCYTLSATAIDAIKALNLPLALTLTDFWFLCPRLTLLKFNGELCNGRKTPQECLDCKLRDAKIYRTLRSNFPKKHILSVFEIISKRPYLTRRPGLRGFALNMADRQHYVTNRLNMADCVMAPSNFVANMFFDAGYSGNIEVIPHGHDLRWLSDYTGKIPSPDFRIGYIGQINPTKGVHLLIEAFRGLKSTQPLQLLIHGPMDESSMYGKQLRKTANADSRIQFKGAFDHSDIGKILANFDVLVMPSLWYEAYGIVIHEAFAAGTPVVASALGAMKENVQNEVSGLLFEPGDVDQLTAQLNRLILEPGLLERLQAGIPEVKSVEQEANEVLFVYEKILNQIGEPNVAQL